MVLLGRDGIEVEEEPLLDKIYGYNGHDGRRKRNALGLKKL